MKQKKKRGRNPHWIPAVEIKARRNRGQNKTRTQCVLHYTYGVATLGRLPKNMRLFCKRALHKKSAFFQKRPIFSREPTKQGSFAKEMYIVKGAYKALPPHSSKSSSRPAAYGWVSSHVYLSVLFESNHDCKYIYVRVPFIVLFCFV